jgi:hypothetical protein
MAAKLVSVLPYDTIMQQRKRPFFVWSKNCKTLYRILSMFGLSKFPMAILSYMLVFTFMVMMLTPVMRGSRRLGAVLLG